MNTRCTQGEWRADYRPGHDSRDRSEWGYAEVVAGEEDAILRADRGEDEDIANVHMAAASKDMYEALDQLHGAVLELIDPDQPNPTGNDLIDLVLKSDQALIKARGENADEQTDVPERHREAG